MPWVLDKAHASFKDLTDAEQSRFDEFQNRISQGMHPRNAADGWDSNYKMLTYNQGQIRLSYANRCTFTIDEGTQKVIILQVGGHT